MSEHTGSDVGRPIPEKGRFGWWFIHGYRALGHTGWVFIGPFWISWWLYWGKRVPYGWGPKLSIGRKRR